MLKSADERMNCLKQRRQCENLLSLLMKGYRVKTMPVEVRDY